MEETYLGSLPGAHYNVRKIVEFKELCALMKQSVEESPEELEAKSSKHILRSFL